MVEPLKDLFNNEPSEVELYAQEFPFTVRVPLPDGQLGFQLYKTEAEADQRIADTPGAYKHGTMICDASAVLSCKKRGQ